MIYLHLHPPALGVTKKIKLHLTARREEKKQMHLNFLSHDFLVLPLLFAKKFDVLPPPGGKKCELSKDSAAFLLLYNPGCHVTLFVRYCPLLEKRVQNNWAIVLVIALFVFRVELKR